MSTEEKSEKTAPKPGRGYTVVELRTPHQAEIVKAHVKGTKAGAVSIEDKWVVVKNADAQLVVDKAIAAGDTMTEFEGRVISFFLAVILLANTSITDSRNTLQSRLIDVGRTTKGFKVGMKSDNKLEVSVGSKTYPTQKEALMALAPDRVKAPAREVDADAKEAKAKEEHARYEAAKVESKLLKEWEAKPDSDLTKGPRPETPNYDAVKAESEEREARKTKEAEARKAEAQEAADKKAAKRDATSTSREVTPRPKAAQARKAS